MFRYRLRTLLIVLALGPAVLAGAWWLVMTDAGRPYLSLAVVAVIAGIATWISFAPERRFWRDVASRESLEDAEFVRRFYGESGVPAEIVLRLLPLYTREFGYEPGKLHPTDRPPLLDELDTNDLAREIEEEFSINIPDHDAEGLDGSFDSIVRYLASRRATMEEKAT